MITFASAIKPRAALPLALLLDNAQHLVRGLALAIRRVHALLGAGFGGLARAGFALAETQKLVQELFDAAAASFLGDLARQGGWRRGRWRRRRCAHRWDRG